jgi:hypothetical protein
MAMKTTGCNRVGTSSNILVSVGYLALLCDLGELLIRLRSVRRGIAFP